MYRTFGTEPVLISNVSPEMRAKVATNTLHNYGYFHGKVDYNVLTDKKNAKKAKVAYNVHAGQLYRLDSIAYVGFPEDMASVILWPGYFKETTLKKGDAFSVVNLSGEQTRIETQLREQGFYYYNAKYTTFRADTIQRKNYVQLQVVPVADRPAQADHRWYIGRCIINVRNHETDVLDHQSVRRNYIYNFSGEKLPLRANMWRHAIVHRHGELYHYSNQKTTMEKLGQLGVFCLLYTSPSPRD